MSLPHTKMPARECVRWLLGKHGQDRTPDGDNYRACAFMLQGLLENQQSMQSTINDLLAERAKWQSTTT